MSPPVLVVGWVHSQSGYYFWDKGIKDFVVALDLNVYYDYLSFNQ